MILDMVIDDNEDPEDRAEREKRERDILRFRPRAIRAGKVSLCVMFSGLLLILVLWAADSRNVLDEVLRPLGCLAFLACGIIGPMVALYDLSLVIRLKLLGARTLMFPVMLGRPTAT